MTDPLASDDEVDTSLVRIQELLELEEMVEDEKEVRKEEAEDE